MANDTVYGLGSHLQSRDPERARRFASRIRAGQVHINYPAWDGERLSRLQALRQRPGIWRVRPGGVSRDQSHPRL